MIPIQKKFIYLPCEIDSMTLKHPVTGLIMSYQEDLIMEMSAQKVCENGGDILNVGFGLGIVDRYISQQQIDSHHIIELHPQLVQNAITSGYTNVYEGDWRDVIENFKLENKKFDGIYFDTHNLGILNDWLDFSMEVDNILKPGGIFSYFNPKTKQKVEEQLIDVLGYQKYSQTIPLVDIKARFETWVEGLAVPWDYPFVWFVKPN